MSNILLAAIAVAALALPAAAQIEEKIADRFWESRKILEEMLNAPDGGIPEDLLQRAECVAVVPGVKRAAFGLGVRYGRGFIVCRNDETGLWGPPSMLSLGGGGFGFQIGGESMDVLLLLMNPDSIDHLLSDQLTIGADVSAAAGPKGRGLSAETSATMGAEILSYGRSRGLFAGISVEGSVLKPDHDANASLYGRRVDPREVLRSPEVPNLATEFVEELNRVAWRPPARQGAD